MFGLLLVLSTIDLACLSFSSDCSIILIPYLCSAIILELLTTG